MQYLSTVSALILHLHFSHFTTLHEDVQLILIVHIFSYHAVAHLSSEDLLHVPNDYSLIFTFTIPPQSIRFFSPIHYNSI